MGNHTPEHHVRAVTLDEVAPRLIRFTEDLINQLRTCGIKTKTTTVYLLNSTDHPIEVPSEANGVRINMNFDATIPHWISEPRARLHARFNDSRRRHFCSERGKSNPRFPMKNVLKMFLDNITIEERKRKLAEKEERRENKSRQAFEELGNKLNIRPESDPDTLQKGNVVIKRLPPKSSEVSVTLTIPYNQVSEIIEKYLKV